MLVKILPLLAIVAALAGAVALDLHTYLSLDAFQEHRATLLGFVADNGVWAYVVAIVIYAVAVALSVPGAVFLTLACGFMFGVVGGSVVAVTGATLGATGLFLAAKTGLGEFLREKAGPRLKKFEAGFNENAFSYLITLRLLPVLPFWLVNLIPAFLGVKLSTYVTATILGIIPATVVYVSIGNGLGATLDQGGEPNLAVIFSPEVLLPLVGLAALSLLPVVVKRFRGSTPSP